MSIMNQVIEAAMDLIDSMENFAPIRRGALGAEAGLVCETAAAFQESAFMDKGEYIAVDLTINGKHPNLQTLSDTLGDIVDNLVRRKEYPSGEEWEIVDITHGAPLEPTIIGREQNGDWLMAAAIVIKYYRKDKIEDERELGE